MSTMDARADRFVRKVFQRPAPAPATEAERQAQEVATDFLARLKERRQGVRIRRGGF